MVRYTPEKRIFLYDNYVEKKILQNVCKKVSPKVSSYSSSGFINNFWIGEESVFVSFLDKITLDYTLF
jgi:hypothetical protein